MNFFFSFQQILFEQTAFLKRTITCRKLYIFTKANCPLDWKKKTAPPPPHPPGQKYSALPSKPPPPHPIFFHLEQLSAVVFWCARMYVCVCVFSNIFSETTGPTEAMWNLHGIGELSLFKWSRSFVVLHYCQPPGGGGRGLLAGILP